MNASFKSLLLPRMRGLSSKIYAAFLLAAVVPTSVAGLVGIFFSVDALKRETLTHLQQEVAARSEGIARFFGQLSSELLYIASSSAFDELVRTDPTDLPQFRKVRNRLERDFSSVAHAYPYIYQIRYIDASGREIVRVDRRNDSIYVVPEEELQDKSRRYYVQEILPLNPREIYVSPLDLNVENGAPESPEKPVIRFGTPIADENDVIHGLLVINLHAAVILDPIQQMAEVRDGIAYLVDRAGWYLSRSAKHDGSFKMKSLNALAETYPRSMLSRVLLGERGTKTLDEWIIAYAPVNLRSPDLATFQATGSQDWRIILAIPRRQLFAAVFNLYFLYAVLALSLAVTGVAGFLVSRRLLRPLTILRAETEAVAAKNFTRRIQLRGTDEIADLGHRFNSMAAELERYYASLESQRQHLEEQVRERTAALERQRKKLSTIIEGTGDGIVSLSRSGAIELANAAAARLFAQARGNVLGRNFSEFWPDWVECARGTNGGKPGPGLRDLHLGNKTLSLNITPVARDGAPEGYIVVARDVSNERQLQEERRELDRQMFQMERMTTMGELAMALAHEIGNPLAGMKAVVQVLLDEDSENSHVERHLLRIEGEIDRLSDFLRTFRGFVAPQEFHPVPCRLEDVLDDVLLWTRKEAATRGIDIELRTLANSDALLWADPNQLKQLLLNLVINAIQAIPKKGYIVISRGGLDCAHCDSDDLVRMRFSIEDSGVGISKEVLSRIFDPFFTTRDGGSGLGLAIVKKIAIQHGANILVTSEVGKGSRFDIDWPTAAPATIDGTVAKRDACSLRASVLKNG
ncbi:ATP-binding protein [Bradyrhizobium sp.]|uniref:ATP-binding protein n=1 Tax=Bradyrhizobium sp. TaxID=376 RepID=UPI004037B569